MGPHRRQSGVRLLANIATMVGSEVSPLPSMSLDHQRHGRYGELMYLEDESGTAPA